MGGDRLSQPKHADCRSFVSRYDQPGHAIRLFKTDGNSLLCLLLFAFYSFQFCFSTPILFYSEFLYSQKDNSLELKSKISKRDLITKSVIKSIIALLDGSVELTKRTLGRNEN